MKVAALVIVILTVSVFASRPENKVPATAVNCSNGWRITGYYTPIETEFNTTQTREIEINGAGKESFNAEFLQVIFNDDQGFGEGWGKTRFGWYLGNYDGGWHKADAPLDAHDKPLQPDTVAVDNAVVPIGSTLTIPDLPGDLGKLEFKSTDVGVSVHGKHVDVYTGEGREARRRMWQFTYEDDEDGRGLTRVCFSQPTATAK
jgi:3D (Asp-Asp-Asp) domain-containing protein